MQSTRPLTQEITKGIISENPVFRLLLGLCPALAVTTSLINGVGMGLAVTFVLMCTNVAISLLKNVIPGKLRIPIYMIVFATFVTITDMMMEVYAPALHKALGIFVPLIVVNCVILARAEMFARKNSVGRSILDGLGTGLGFTLGLSVLAGIREVLGNGTLLDYPVMGQAFEPVLLMMLPAGGFFVLGFIVAALKIKDLRSEAKKRAQTVIPHS